MEGSISVCVPKTAFGVLCLDSSGVSGIWVPVSAVRIAEGCSSVLSVARNSLWTSMHAGDLLMISRAQLMHENLRFVHLRRTNCVSTSPVQVRHIFFLHSLQVIVIDGVILQISHISIWYLRCVTITSCGPDSTVSRPSSASRVLSHVLAGRSFIDSAESAAVGSLVLLSRGLAARSVSDSVAGSAAVAPVSVVASFLEAT